MPIELYDLLKAICTEIVQLRSFSPILLDSSIRPMGGDVMDFAIRDLLSAFKQDLVGE